MDVQREGHKRKKLIRRIVWGSGIGIPLLILFLFVFNLDPAAPKIESDMIWTDSVRQDTLIREVRGLGALVPEDIRWIAASTQGRVERRVILPGATVKKNDVILELSNSELMQELNSAKLALDSARARLTNTEVQLRRQLLEIQSNAVRLKGEYEQAQLDQEVNEELAKEGLLAELKLKQSQVRARDAKTRFEIEQQRLRFFEESMEPQMATEKASVETAQASYELIRKHVDELVVRAPQDGVLQQVPVEEGQRVQPGTNLARVADPSRLKAEVRIPETQARDILIGQDAKVDTRNGVIEGRVMRIDPAVQNGTVTVDIELLGDLPKGARPDLTIDGTIQLEVLEDVLMVQRPGFGRENATVGVFKLDSAGEYAYRTSVHFGKSSVNYIQVLGGLKSGDSIILSDTSNYDNFDKIKISN